MANSNFVVQNGLTVGNVTIDSSTSNITLPSGSSITIGAVAVTPGPSVAINATAVTTGTFYPVCVAAAGSGQTPSVRTTATAFSIDMATNVLTTTANQAKYADLAERYKADQQYEPGTVVEFGAPEEVRLVTEDMTTRVAGVVTTNPAYLMNIEIKGKFLVDLALQGRVPTKVVGSVARGDMMVATVGGKVRSEANPKIGSIVGKSLEDFIATPEKPEAIIEVVVGKT